MQAGGSGRRLGLIAAAIVVAALVVSASILATQGSRATETSTTTVLDTASLTSTSTSTLDLTTTVLSTTTVTNSSLPPVPCDYNALAGGLPNPVPVLLMQPNSTGYVCVVYQTVWAGNETSYASQYSKYTSYELGPFQVSYQCMISDGTKSCTGGNSHSFDNTATPSSVGLSGSTDYFTAVLGYTALANSTGFYSYGFPGLGCGVTWPLAVGYPPSEVNSSDFLLPPGPPLCPAGWNVPVTAVSAYLTGMNITSVPYARGD
jgi:hypothetical protein